MEKRRRKRTSRRRYGLNTDDAAVYIGCSESLLRKLRDLGEGPNFSRIGSRKIVYPIPELKQYLQDNLVK